MVVVLVRGWMRAGTARQQQVQWLQDCHDCTSVWGLAEPQEAMRELQARLEYRPGSWNTFSCTSTWCTPGVTSCLSLMLSFSPPPPLPTQIGFVRRVFDEGRDNPPLARNMPPVAGAIKWSRGLLVRLRRTWVRLQALNSQLERMDSGKRAALHMTGMEGRGKGGCEEG